MHNIEDILEEKVYENLKQEEIIKIIDKNFNEVELSF